MKIFLSLIAAILCLSSCEHKDLCYTHPHDAFIRVDFCWDSVPETDRPEGMRVYFYKTLINNHPLMFDFPDGKGDFVSVTQDFYNLLCFNYDATDISFTNTNDFWNMTAETALSYSPDGKPAKLTPSLLFGHFLADVDLKDIPEDSTRTVTFTPKRLVCRYSYEVRGINGTQNISDIRATLSGMSDALIIADDKLPDGRNESLIFRGSVKDQNIVGAFYTFGYCKADNVKQIFTLYIKNRQGKLFTIQQDVTDQVHAVPVIGHLADVHLIINVDLDIPNDPGGGGDSGNGAGFDVDVDEWQDVNTEIII